MNHVDILETMAEEKNPNLTLALQPHINILKASAPLLVEALEKYRNDPHTNEEFQKHLKQIVDEDQWTSRNIACVARSFSATHNHLEEKPIVGIAQQMGKIIDAVYMLIEYYGDIELHSNRLKNVIKKISSIIAQLLTIIKK